MSASPTPSPFFLLAGALIIKTVPYSSRDSSRGRSTLVGSASIHPAQS